MSKERFCPNCGESMGTEYADRYDTCGNQECEREARSEYQAEQEERQDRAIEDGFSRY